MSRPGWQSEIESLTRQVGRVLCLGRQAKLERLAEMIRQGEAALVPERDRPSRRRETLEGILRRAEAAARPFAKPR